MSLTSQNFRRRWLWGFVAQDALDLILWAALLRRASPRHRRVCRALAGTFALTVIDTYAAVTRNARPLSRSTTAK